MNNRVCQQSRASNKNCYRSGQVFYKCPNVTLREMERLEKERERERERERGGREGERRGKRETLGTIIREEKLKRFPVSGANPSVLL